MSFSLASQTSQELPAMQVSDITSLIKEILEGSFPNLCIEGEISNYRPSSTGHLYFTLKDSTSAISAVMFKGRSRSIGFEPKDGMLVRVRGSISVYEARGSYQIIVESMELAGTGDILKLLEQRKQKLALEGVFDQDKKKALPAFPEKIVVITSPTGAALKDILQVIKRRNPSLSIVILPAPVQGAQAAPLLTQQVQIANRFSLGEVIIIGRGGGSLEDLLPFSDEDLVRAIGASAIPVISAVGHEIDWALSDFAADVRAPTPSAAAELVCPVKDEIIQDIRAIRESFIQLIDSKLEKAKLLSASFSSDSLEMRFRKIEQPFLLKFDDLKEELLMVMNEKLTHTQHRFALIRQAFLDTNPQLILERGYSIVQNKTTGKTIRTTSELSPDTELLIRPAAGTALVHVKEILS